MWEEVAGVYCDDLKTKITCISIECLLYELKSVPDRIVISDVQAE